MPVFFTGATCSKSDGLLRADTLVQSRHDKLRMRFACADAFRAIVMHRSYIAVWQQF